MKKTYKLLVPFLVLSSSFICGCKNKQKETNKILLTFGDVHSSGITDIDITKLGNLRDDKESFMFVVSSTTCGCWRDTRDAIETYIKTNKLICYRMNYEDFKDYAVAYDLPSVSSGTSTFAIFENGKVKYSLRSDEHDEINTADAFKKFMDATIKLPSLYYIKEEDYNLIKESDKNAIVYFERSACPDCTYINPTMLKNYVLSHEDMNKIYVLDCQPWKSLPNEQYQQKKDDFGLSTADNITFGYDAGVFPFFSYLEAGKYKSGAVIFNDEVDQETLKITNSYYTNERISNLGYNAPVLLNKQLSISDIKNGSWTHESAANVYKPILNAFLDYALPKVNYIF